MKSGKIWKMKKINSNFFVGKASAFILVAAIVLFFSDPSEAYIEYGTPDHSTGNLDYVNKSFYMEMTAPDDVKITSLRIYNDQTDTGDQFRFAIYVGGTLGNPSGASLIYESSMISHAGIGRQEFPLNTTLFIDKDDTFGVAIKWAGKALRKNFNSPSSGLGDCNQHYYNLDDLFFTAFNPTLGSVEPVAAVGGLYAYINFAVMMNTYPVIDSVTPNTDINDNQANIHISGTGLRYINSGVWLTQNNDWDNPGIKVLQKGEPYPNDTDVYFTTVFENLQGPTAYLWLDKIDANDSDIGRPGEITETGYPLAINTFDTTGPLYVPGSLTVAPDDGAFTLGTFALTGAFDDYESRVYLCEYSINGGVSWYEGTVSGMASPYICSADISRSNGANVDLTFRAYSGGGMTEAGSSLTRTVDTVGPVESATPSALSSDGICTITLLAATDAGSGMHSTEAYEIRQQEYSVWNGCENGTQVYIGTDTNFVHSGLKNGGSKYYTICYKDNLGQQTESANFECVMPDVYLRHGGISPETRYIQQDTVAVVNTFVMRTENTINPADTYSDTITAIDIIYDSNSVTYFHPAAVEFVKLYKDDGSVVNELDAGDTFIASSNTTENVFQATEWHFTGLSIPVTAIDERHLIVLDFVSSFKDGDGFKMRVKRAFSEKTYSEVTNYAGSGPQLMSDSTPPVTSATIQTNANEWQNDEVLVTFNPNDITAEYAGSGVDPADGIFGCFGDGCTPTPLGTGEMTATCSTESICFYNAINYYAVDRAGNVEAIKTRTDELIKIDRVPPIAGTLTASYMTNPVQLTWQGFSDTDSGLTQSQTFFLRRAEGLTPPANCSSDNLRYIGSPSASSYDDTGTEGQDYAYRLCVYDGAGNENSVTITARAETCTIPTLGCWSCHSLPAGGAHIFHGMPCKECHETQLEVSQPNDPSHTDGIIRLRGEITTYTGGDSIPYPSSFAPPRTCGGSSGIIGGNENYSPPQNPPTVLPCHWGADWGGFAPMDNPATTPFWECVWDNTGTCTDVGALPPPELTDCASCHGVPVVYGASGEYAVGAHDIHSSIACMVCHQESGPDPFHASGMVTVVPDTAWNGPNPQPWPDVAPNTCGGPAMPVGGNGTGGAMGCHMESPVINPNWECVWDEFRNCWDPASMGP